MPGPPIVSCVENRDEQPDSASTLHGDLLRFVQVLRHVVQVAFGVDGSHAARACRSHGLTVYVVLHVAGCKDAGHARVRAIVRHDVTVRVELELTSEERRIRRVADGDEHAVERQALSCPVFTLRTTIPVTSPFSTSVMSAISESQMNSIFGFAKALSCMIFDARRLSRR